MKFLPGAGSNKYGRMDKISSVFGASTGGGGENSDTSPITEITGGENSSMCPSMGFKDRMIAFRVCTGIGIMFSLGGTINLFFMNYAGTILNNPDLFNRGIRLRRAVFSGHDHFPPRHWLPPRPG